MEITQTTVRALKIVGAVGVDPIDVFIQNYEPGKGRMTIRVWDRAWTCAWFAMRGQSIEQFFLEADTDYILNNFSTEGMRVDAVKRETPYMGRIVGAIKEALRQTTEGGSNE